jgi:hypothetical protein
MRETKSQYNNRVQLPALIVGAAIALSAGCKDKPKPADEETKAATPSKPRTRLDDVQVLMKNVAMEKSGPNLVATDDAVFLTTDDGIIRLSPTGSGRKTVVPFSKSIRFLGVDGDTAIVSEDRSALQQFPLATPTKVTTLCSDTYDFADAFDSQPFAVDSENIYWRRPKYGKGKTIGTFTKCPRVADSKPSVIATVTSKAEGAGALTVGAGKLFFGDSDGDITSVAMKDGVVKKLVDGLGMENGITGIACDGEYVYFARMGTRMPGPGGNRYKDGSIERVRVTGGDAEKLSQSQEWPEHLAIDDKSVYWATRDGSIKRAKKAGGGVEELGKTEQIVKVVAVTAENVYWLLGGTSENAYHDAQLVGRGK